MPSVGSRWVGKNQEGCSVVEVRPSGLVKVRWDSDDEILYDRSSWADGAFFLPEDPATSTVSGNGGDVK